MIWGYWEGPRKWYYDLCWRTVLKHNPDARLLSLAEVVAEIGPIPPEFDGVYIIHKVDWIRKKWIHKVGGLWLDMDFVCFKPLDRILWLLEEFEFVCYHEWPGNWMDNFLAARPGCKALEAAAEYALERVQQRGKDVAWLATNADALAHGLGKHGWGYHLSLPTHLISPVDVNNPQWFCDDMNPSETLDSFQCYGFITSWHGLSGWLANKTEQSLLAGKSRLAAIINKALA